jgi:hypothetical protein
MDTKFCFSCATYKKVDQLSKIKRGNIQRLICNDCLEMKSGSFYSKKEKKDVKKVE